MALDSTGLEWDGMGNGIYESYRAWSWKGSLAENGS